MAPIRVQGLAPHMPDPSDNGTMLAGIAKRLMPERPAEANHGALAELELLTDELTQLVRAVPARDPDELLAELLAGRPQHEAAALRAGWESAEEDPERAIADLAHAPYKCFVKAEAYPEASHKPPRFIMTLTLEQRGMQAFFLRPMLDRIERATSAGNVKHLTPQGITDKLRDRFADVARVCETDYTAFESSISPDVKNSVENRLFLAVADDDDQRAFVRQVLARRHVNVMGPTFHIPHMPHIRMSGDQHTSIGNLVTNLVVSAYATGRSVRELLDTGLFEGDDGVYPLGDCDPLVLQARAAEVGFTLKVKTGRWDELSFCGRNFVVFEDYEYMARSSERVLVGLTTLFSARQDSQTHDLMLQRAKALSVLAVPYAPRSTCVAAIIEFATRSHMVSERYLARNGLLKEYSPYGVEACVPEWLRSARNAEDLAQALLVRERAAGGDWSYRTLLRAARAAMRGQELVLPLDFLVTQGLCCLSGYSPRGGITRFTEDNMGRWKVAREDELDVTARRVYASVKQQSAREAELYPPVWPPWLTAIAYCSWFLLGRWCAPLAALVALVWSLTVTPCRWREDDFYEPMRDAPLLRRARHRLHHMAKRPLCCVTIGRWHFVMVLRVLFALRRFVNFWRAVLADEA